MFSRFDQVSLTHVIRLVGWQKRVKPLSGPVLVGSDHRNTIM